MHPEAFAWMTAQATKHGPFRSVIDLGGRNINGSPRLLFPGAGYTAIDLVAGPGVDIVADARLWAPDEPVDCVVCCEVLEHDPAPYELVEAAWKWLAPGGRLLLTAASTGRAPHSAVDGGPVRWGEYYGNLDPEQLKGWMGDWADVHIEDHIPRGDVYATGVRP